MAPYPRQLLFLTLFILLSLTLYHQRILFSSPQPFPPSPLPPILTTPPSTPLPPTLDLSSPTSPFISWPLSRLCNESYAPSPPQNLTFLCDSNSGGPGNIRNYILTCVRYALSAGARSLVLPSIRARSPSNPSDLFHGRQPFAYLFDSGHFASALGAACPGLRVYADLSSVPGVREPEATVRRVMPKSFGGSRAGCDAREANRHTDRFGDAFRGWVAEKEKEKPGEPVVVRFTWGVLWDWPVVRDGPEVAATFGGLLRFRADVIELADGIVERLRREAMAAAKNHPWWWWGGGGRGRRAGTGAYLGVHLRTEEDALSRWPDYAAQSEGYFQEAEKQGFRGGIAYLASGSESETSRFAAEARERLKLEVRSKYDLVDGAKLDQLKTLTWDQQALVDFVVLLHSDYFVGVSPSSFSINVALKRHLQKEGLYTRPWKVGGPGDGRSWLVGKYEKYWEDWLFMFDGMWP
ncbi:hypothetical protein F4810DRAFT_706581 [Camillea tinctor]|nr:hypothetical protein F4810DRAFT_706581 [Camillea tinctor]